VAVGSAPEASVDKRVGAFDERLVSMEQSLATMGSVAEASADKIDERLASVEQSLVAVGSAPEASVDKRVGAFDERLVSMEQSLASMGSAAEASADKRMKAFGERLASVEQALVSVGSVAEVQRTSSEVEAAQRVNVFEERLEALEHAAAAAARREADSGEEACLVNDAEKRIALEGSQQLGASAAWEVQQSFELHRRGAEEIAGLHESHRRLVDEVSFVSCHVAKELQVFRLDMHRSQARIAAQLSESASRNAVELERMHVELQSEDPRSGSDSAEGLMSAFGASPPSFPVRPHGGTYQTSGNGASSMPTPRLAGQTATARVTSPVRAASPSELAWDDETQQPSTILEASMKTWERRCFPWMHKEEDVNDRTQLSSYARPARPTSARPERPGGRPVSASTASTCTAVLSASTESLVPKPPPGSRRPMSATDARKKYPGAPRPLSARSSAHEEPSSGWGGGCAVGPALAAARAAASSRGVR